MATKKLQILDSLIKQAENANTLGGKYASDFLNTITLTTVFDENFNVLVTTDATTIPTDFATDYKDNAKYVFVPSNVTQIEAGAFYYCTNITDVFIDNTRDEISMLYVTEVSTNAIISPFPVTTNIFFIKGYNTLQRLLLQMYSRQGTSWIDVTTLGVKNDGTYTSLGNALNNDSNKIYYFPKGTYLSNGFTFKNCENVTLICDEAIFEYQNNDTDETDASGSTVQEYIFKFNHCKNIKIQQGIFNGNNKVKNGIIFNNTPNFKVDDCQIKYIGNNASDSSGGLCLVGDCSNSIINNVIVEYVTAGTISSDNYIHSRGISIVIDYTNRAYSRNILINNPRISNITGTPVGETKVDGDGIFIIQQPQEGEDYESNITINNPYITNCDKRALKISARCVNVFGGCIDVASWSPAVEYQYVRNSSIRDISIRSKNTTCLCIYGGDGVFEAHNVYMSSENGVGHGIVLYRTNGNNVALNNGGENITITNCTFNDVMYPILGSLSSIQETKVITDTLRISNCNIGLFKGDAAVKLDPSRFTSIRTLEVINLNFTQGSCKQDIFASNNAYYEQDVEGGIVCLGNTTTYINPTLSLSLYSNNLSDDFREDFKNYNFDAKYQYFGGNMARYDDVFEYPELLHINDITITSATNSNFSATVSSNKITIVCDTAYDSDSYVYLPIENLTLSSTESYNLTLETSQTSSASITLCDDKFAQVLPSAEVNIDRTVRIVEYSNVSATPTKLRIKLRAGQTINTELKLSLKNRDGKIKGMTELLARIQVLESQLSST